MRLVTTDALTATAFMLDTRELDINPSQRRVVVSGESARRIRAGLGEPLALRTFALVDQEGGIELAGCYILRGYEGEDERERERDVTILYRRRQSV